MISKEAGNREVIAPLLASALGSRRAAPWVRLASIYLDWRQLLWNAFLLVATPALFAMKLRRRVRKHNGQEFDLRRWFVRSSSLSPGGGQNIVLFGASFGEMLLMDRLTRSLRQSMPELRFTWAMRDPQTYAHIKSTRADVRVVNWPFDSLFPVAAWMRKNRPDAIVFVERYNFPCLVAAANRWGSKVVLASGRAKNPSFKESSIVRAYYRWVFDGFDTLCMQGEKDRETVGRFTSSPRCLVTGNIKFDLASNGVPENDDLASWLTGDGRPLLIAGSTDDATEERFVLDAFEVVVAGTPARLLIAPRNTSRAAETIDLASGRGFTTSRRTDAATEADVLILDTMGELASAYRFGKAAFIGGTVTGMGHNVLEPLEHGVPVSYGPAPGHFVDLQRLCERSGVGFRVVNSTQLAHHWIAMLRDDSLRDNVAKRAEAMLTAASGAIKATADELAATITAGR